MRQRRSIGLAALALLWVTACGGSNGTALGVATTQGATTSSPDTTSPASATTSSSGAPAATRAPNSTTVPRNTTVPKNTTVATPAPIHPTTTNTQAVATTATTKKQRPQVKLPTGGVRGPADVDPSNTPAYQLFTMGGDSCRQLLDAINTSWGDPAGPDDPTINRVRPPVTYLYRSAAEACLLDFARAKTDYDHFLSFNLPPFGDNCPDPAVARTECEKCHKLVLQWLSAQIAAYDRDHSYAPLFVADSSTTPAPCPPDTTTTVP